MEERIDALLAERRRRRPFGRAGSIATAAALHVALLLAMLLAPRLAAQRETPPEYVAVQIVPLQALGVERPQVAPKPAPPPPPQPEPKPVEEPKPASEVVMPEPARKPAPAKPTPKPEAEAKAAPPAPAPPAPSSAAQPERPGSEAGSAAGTAAFGASVATLDNPDFTYGYYIEQMLALIRAQWVRPPLGGGIEAAVHFEVGRSGEITDVRIVQSSGYSSFDLAGMRAVQTASPLPPLPSGYKQSSLGVNLIIR